jgi:uncharacterized membrane protein YeiH
MKKFIQQIFTDESGVYSSKRFVGILCSLALITALIVDAFTAHKFKSSSSIVDAVALLAFGSLGLTSIDKWTKKK